MGFTAREFLMDFGQYDQDSGAAIRHTRIITYPESAKIFLQMLSEMIAEFESKVGPIGGDGE
jgi:hypothetical protein